MPFLESVLLEAPATIGRMAGMRRRRRHGEHEWSRLESAMLNDSFRTKEAPFTNQQVTKTVCGSAANFITEHMDGALEYTGRNVHKV